MKSRLLVFLIQIALLLAVSTVHAGEALCPRGTYAFTKGENGLNEIVATVTLPTPGYRVSLTLGSEFIFPPIVYFRCEKPSGMVAQVLTRYTQSLRLNFKQVLLQDKDGQQRLDVNAPSGKAATAAEPKQCSTNEQCAEGEFCDTSPQCQDDQAAGICKVKPEACTREFMPVNGCDGKVYANRCSAAAAGQPITGPAQENRIIR